jgi:phosphoribosylformylglycinamidine synthase
MAKPQVLVLRAPGTNCDLETAYAFECAGADAERVHVNSLLDEPRQLRRYQVICIPGGFSYGDDVAAGKILATKIQHHLFDELREFHAAEKLLLGICNGFQVLLKTGLLFDQPTESPPATLFWNDRGRYEARWVTVQAEAGHCVFLRGVKTMYLPMAHAEGKFMARDKNVLRQLETNRQLALRYVVSPECLAETEANGPSNGGRIPTSDEPANVPFPFNPNGSEHAVAGFCDPTGRAFGLMPHPERFIQPTQHPRWTREGLRPNGEGLRIFQNAVEYFG